MEQDKINKIKQLHNEGKKCCDIAKELQISIPTVYYYLDEDFRKRRLQGNVNWFKNLPIERRRVYYKQRVPYLREYKVKRYKADEEYRNKEVERIKLWHKSKTKKNSGIIEDSL
jgi:hypothetical protein